MHSPNAGLLLHEKSKMRTNKGGLWLAVLVGVKREFDFVGFAAQVVAVNRYVDLDVGVGIRAETHHAPTPLDNINALQSTLLVARTQPPTESSHASTPRRPLTALMTP